VCDLFGTDGMRRTMNSEEADRLLASVQRQLAGRVCELRLLVEENGVVIQGRAYTYYAKQLAQQAVMKATGLPLLANNIEVLSPLTVRRAQP
jgi:hypothetical protein